MAIKRATSPIEIYRGDSYVYQYQIIDVDDETGVEQPVDITDYEIASQVRLTPDSDAIWFELPIEKTEPSIGVFSWTLTEAESKSLLPPNSQAPNTAVYDMQLRIPNEDPDKVQVITFLRGSFTVITDVTRLK